MRRELNGRIAASVVALWFVPFLRWPEAPGETDGKRALGLDGVVYEPSGAPGIELPGRSKLGRSGIPASGDDSDDAEEEDEDEFAAEAISTVASEWYAVAPGAVTVAVSVTCAPATASVSTAEPASSSSAGPAGRSLIVQTLLSASAHIANFGAATSVTLLTLVVTVTPVAATFVLHTKIAKLAVPPGSTLVSA
jgi:hypothetical protein